VVEYDVLGFLEGRWHGRSGVLGGNLGVVLLSFGVDLFELVGDRHFAFSEG